MMPGGRMQGNGMPGGRPGRMMPGGGGRGRMMPGGGGRGRMTQARHHQMPGRGGRGRMAMPARGGGRGRSMQSGRGGGGRFNNGRSGGGRGYMGRGGRVPVGRGRGRGQMMSMGPPSKLDVFNKYVGSKISSCLTREEQETLGMAYPKLRPRPLTQQQQMMMARQKMMLQQKKEFEAHKVNKEDKKPEISDTNTDDEPVKGDGEEENKGHETEAGIEMDKEDPTDDSEKEADLIDAETIDDAEKSTENGEVEKKPEADPNETEVKTADQLKDDTEVESQTRGKEEKKLDGDETEDKTDEVCQLTIDADETIPPPDPECDCENCVTALSTTKTCNCESCRTSRIKAIQACDCVRCRALRERLTRVFSLSEQECDCKSCRAKKLDPEKKAEMMKAREESMRINLTDCDTLLAQLNTKRLYRRIKHFKRQDKSYDVNKAYPYKRTTDEIADIEWGELLEDYKIRRTDLFPDYKREGSEEKERNTDDEDSDDDTDSSDDEDKEYEYVGDKPSKYELLMFTPCPRAVAVLASYPRSGNSLMRNLYEKITLRVTGSDMMGGLQKHDLVGEMATGTNNVQFVKTHYPERMGAPAFPVSRAVLLVRNPYDAMDSYFNLMSTNSHNTSVTKADRKKYGKIFGEMAKKEVLVWRDFHEFWLKQKIPLLVVRYEDLIRWTTKVIGKVIKFVLEVNSMTFFEDRIQRAIGEDQIEKLGPYKARSGGIGKSLTKGNYSAHLLHQINYGIMGTMEKFGYKEMLIPKPSEWRLEPLDQLGYVNF